MNTFTVNALRAFIAAALGVLLLIQTVALPLTAHDLAVDAPEFAYLRVPLLVVCIAGLACVQAVLVCTWRLLTMTSDGEVFSDDARPWVDAIIVSLVVGCVLWVGTGLWLGSEPGVGPITVILAPIVAGAASGAAALLMSVMKMLLVQATAQSVELAEVV